MRKARQEAEARDVGGKVRLRPSLVVMRHARPELSVVPPAPELVIERRGRGLWARVLGVPDEDDR